MDLNKNCTCIKGQNLAPINSLLITFPKRSNKASSSSFLLASHSEVHAKSPRRNSFSKAIFCEHIISFIIIQPSLVAY